VATAMAAAPPTSLELLSGLRERGVTAHGQRGGESAAAARSRGHEGPGAVAAERVIRDLRSFLLERPGRAAGTQAIVDRFRAVVDAEDSAIFKTMLKQIADRRRDQDSGEVLWHLKEEFLPV
jgi:hypothetical protein